MTSSLDEHRDLLEEVCEQWDRAEANIKRAEQLVDGAMIPSINELRYAGRRVMEAARTIIKNGDPKKIEDKLRDAMYDCHRAQHDAVDASFQAVSIKMDAAVSRLSMTSLLTAFPDYPRLKALLRKVEDQVVESRANRENRDAIYDSLQQVEFETLLTLFRDFVANEDTMKAIAREERWEKMKSSIFGWGGLFLGAIAIVVAIIFAY